MNRLQLLSLAATGALAATLAGCTTESSGGGDQDTTVVRATMDAPTTIDPRRALALPDFQLARLAYDTLLRRDDSGLVPGLASSWTATPTEVDFTVDGDATCADGTPITAQVVADSINSFVADGEPSTVAAIFGGTKPQASATDETTVRVSVDVPWAELPQAFTVASTGIVCPAGRAAGADLAAGPVEGAESGPYTMTAFEPGVRYEFQLRDDYDSWPAWTTDIEGEVPKTIEYVVAPDPSATANLVLSGDLDLARIMPDSRSRFDGSDDIELASFPFGTFFLLFNERKDSPFKDEAARIAVAEAVDRDALNQTTTDGTGVLGVTLANAGNTCVPESNDAIIQPDAAAAASVLKGMPIRVLGAQVVGASGAGNVYLEESLRSAGADVTLDNVDIGTWSAKAFGEPTTWDVTIFPDLNFLGSLANALPLFLGPDILDGGPNLGGVDNPVVGEAFDKARAEEDEASRCALYNEAADSLIERADAVPLLTEQYIYAQRDGFKVYMLGGSLDGHIFRITG